MPKSSSSKSAVKSANESKWLRMKSTISGSMYHASMSSTTYDWLFFFYGLLLSWRFYVANSHLALVATPTLLAYLIIAFGYFRLEEAQIVKLTETSLTILDKIILRVSILINLVEFVLVACWRVASWTLTILGAFKLADLIRRANERSRMNRADELVELSNHRTATTSPKSKTWANIDSVCTDDDSSGDTRAAAAATHIIETNRKSSPRFKMSTRSNKNKINFS